MVAQGNLNRALKKISKYNGKEWVGYLTPSEIEILIHYGATVKEFSTYLIDYALQRRQEGKSNSCWFYFTLSKELQKLLGS